MLIKEIEAHVQTKEVLEVLIRRNDYKYLFFKGEPGTGKTMISKFLANSLKESGLLKFNKVTEVDKSSLESPFVDMTAQKISEVIQSSLDGILFVDNVSELSEKTIQMLLSNAKEYSDRLVVIFSDCERGFKIFTDKISPKQYFHIINFPNYTVEELLSILQLQTDKYSMEITPEALSYVEDLLKNNPTNGNGRLIRSILNKALANQARRIHNDFSSDEREKFVLKKSDFLE